MVNGKWLIVKENLPAFTIYHLPFTIYPVSFYNPKINERFQAPQNTGRAALFNAVGTNATFVCGAALRFTLRIDKATKEIIEAKFQTNGCGYLMASADVLAEKIVGKSLTGLHGLEALTKEIETELGIFAASRAHCLRLSLDTLQAAFNDFRSAQIEEWAGDKALICTCFGVSEETIERVIVEQNLETVEEVIDVCRAGGGCGSCRFLIQEIIDSSMQNF